MINKTKNIWIGIVVVVLVIGAYYFGTSSKNSTEPVDNNQNTTIPVVNQEQAPVKQTVPQATTETQTKKVANIEESRACAQQATIVAKNDQDFGVAHGAPLGPGFSYQNHYNSTLGKCLFLSTDVATINNNSVLDEVLSDAYDNTTIASYYDEISPANVIVTEVCNINGVMGCTNKQFRAFLNAEMESTIH